MRRNNYAEHVGERYVSEFVMEWVKKPSLPQR